MRLLETTQISQIAHDSDLRRRFHIDPHISFERCSQSLGDRTDCTDLLFVEDCDGEVVADLVTHGSVGRFDLLHPLNPVVESDGEPTGVQFMDLMVRCCATVKVEMVIKVLMPIATM